MISIESDPVLMKFTYHPCVTACFRGATATLVHTQIRSGFITTAGPPQLGWAAYRRPARPIIYAHCAFRVATPSMRSLVFSSSFVRTHALKSNIQILIVTVGTYALVCAAPMPPHNIGIGIRAQVSAGTPVSFELFDVRTTAHASHHATPPPLARLVSPVVRI